VAGVGNLPLIPGVSCPATAAALGAAGLGPICQVASGVAGAVGSAVGSAATQVAGYGANSVLDALGGWVSDGATWLLAQIGTVIGDSTGIDLGASWFTAHYQTMAVLAAVVILPLLLLGIMQSIYRQNASMLIRSVVVNVPLAILLTAVAVKLVALGLAVTDSLSSAVSNGAGLDTGDFLSSVTAALSGASAAGQPGAPTFVVFLGGLAVVFGALMVWIELLIRSAAIYVAVLFLPLALASLAWPAIAHWTRRLVDTLVALILGKFVIVSVLSLAAGALAGGTGSTPSGSAASTAGGGGGFSAVLAGAALLLLSAFAPWALFRLLPFVEAGAVGHLEGISHRARQVASAPAKGLAQVAMRAPLAGAGVPATSLSGAAAGAIGGAAVHGAAAGGGTAGGGTPAGDAAGGSRPEPGPSSAESTGVGTTEPPGHGIAGWEVDPEATATARRLGLDRPGHGMADLHSAPDAPAPPATPTVSNTSGDRGTTALKLLPRQTGALRADALGRDELGIRLMPAPTLPTAPGDGDGPDRQGPGWGDDR